MIFSVIQVIAIFLIPALIIRLNQWKLTRLIGTIGTAYLLGILEALVIFALRKFGVEILINQDIGEIGSHLAISVAIPLLLFSANLGETRKLSKTVLWSFGLEILSVVLVCTVAYLVIGKSVPDGNVLAGMASGLYTGGTPNLNAIGRIMGLDSTTIGVANLSDMIIGGVFYLFLLVACKPLLSLFMRKSGKEIYVKETIDIQNTEVLDLKDFRPTKRLVGSLLMAIFMAILGAGFGILVWILFGAVEGRMTDILVPVMMVTVTVLGIAASFNKKVRETKGTNILGQYLILVFSFALASSLDLTKMQGNFGRILLLYGVITGGIFLVHVILSTIFRIDLDCTMVTLAAGLYGPAFIPAITKQIHNDALTVPGLICGSIGYAIGTFLGVGLAGLYGLF
jgi:uncharacterized membrane protein